MTIICDTCSGGSRKYGAMCCKENLSEDEEHHMFFKFINLRPFDFEIAYTCWSDTHFEIIVKT